MKPLVLVILVAVSTLIPGRVIAQDMTVKTTDLRIEQSIEGGYYLFIRKKPGVSSVLLTESTEDPNYEAASYAWRSLVPHVENQGEKRILDGKFIDDPTLHFLVDSTPVADPSFGQAFKIFIPYVLAYGYEGGRNGQQQVLDGTYMSVRTFTKPYADYTGAYKDNPFIVRVTQKPLEGPPEGNFMDETVRTYTDIADNTNASFRYSRGEADVVETIAQILRTQRGKTLDVVICIDTTKSMENDIPWLKRNLIPTIRDILAPFTSWRIGVLMYRDYMEEYLYQTTPFTSDLGALQRNLDRIRATGGRDIPEAVNEALYAAIKDYVWLGENRLVILVGDAPPHPIPRGSVTPEKVTQIASEQGVSIHTIVLPQ